MATNSLGKAAILATVAFSLSCEVQAEQLLTLTRAAALEDIRQAQEFIRANHAAPFVHVDESEWELIAQEQSKNLLPEVSLLELHRRLSRITGALGCAHSFLNLSEELSSKLNDDARGFPEPVAILGGRLYFAGALQPGTEILSINGVPSARVLESVWAGGSIDGFGVERKSQEAARRFSYLYATQVDPYPEEFRVEVRGRETPILLAPTSGLVSPGGPAGEAFLSVSATGSGALTLTIRGFYDQDSDGQFAEFLAAASNAIAEDPDRPVLLDLRGNPGGIDALGVATIRLFASKPFTVYSTITSTESFQSDSVEIIRRRDGIRTIFGADGQEETPAAEQPHSGKLLVLVDQRTGSTAADVASHLDAFMGAVVIGQETTGAYNANSSGYLNRYVLANSGSQLYLPQWRYTTTAASSARRHRGVIPDIPVHLLPDDIATGRDRVLEVASELVLEP